MAKLYTKQGIIDSSIATGIDSTSTRKMVSGVQKIINDVAEEKQDEAVRYAKMAQDTFVKGAKVEASSQMRGLYSQYQNDPLELKNQFSQMNDELSKKIPMEEARVNFLADTVISQNAYLSRAEENYKKTEVKRAKTTSQNVVQSNIEVLEQIADTYFSDFSQDYDPKDQTTFTPKDKDKIMAQMQIEGIINELNSANPDGSPMYTVAEQEKVQSRLDNMKVSGYKNYIDTLMISSETSGAAFMNEIESDPVATQERYMLSREQYDKIKSYNKTIRTAYGETKDKINPETGLPYTDVEKIAIADNVVNISTMYSNMDFKKGKVTNKAYNNIDSLVNFRDGAYAIRQQPGGLTKDKYNTYMVNSGIALMNMIEDENFDIGKKSIESLMKIRTNELKASPEGKLQIFEDVWRALRSEKIPVNSIDPKDKAKVDELFKTAVYSYFTEEKPSSLFTTSQEIISDEYIASFDPRATGNEGFKLEDQNSSYKQEFDWEEGQWYNVKYNADGTVRDRAPAMIMGAGI